MQKSLREEFERNKNATNDAAKIRILKEAYKEETVAVAAVPQYLFPTKRLAAFATAYVLPVVVNVAVKVVFK